LSFGLCSFGFGVVCRAAFGLRLSPVLVGVKLYFAILVSGLSAMSVVVGDYALDPGLGRVYRGFGVVVEGGVIVDAGEGDVLVGRYPRYERLVVKRGVIVPSFVDSHTHLAMVLLRARAGLLGMGEWFSEVVLPRERLLGPAEVGLGSLVGGVELALSGASGFVDMYFHEESVVEAGRRLGLRGVYTYGMVDNGDPAKAESELRETRRLADLVASLGDRRVRTAVAPHTPYTCSPALLSEAATLARERGLDLHIHLAERADEKRLTAERFGVEVRDWASYLSGLGVLGGGVSPVCFHCTHLSQDEFLALGRGGGFAVLNPTSNLRLGNGAPPIRSVLSSGIGFGLGTDGAASNDDLSMLSEAKLLALLAGVGSGLDVWGVLRALTLPAERFFGVKVGLRMGCTADLAVFRMGLGSNPAADPALGLVFSPGGFKCEYLFVGGKPVVEAGSVVGVDVDSLMDDYERVVYSVEGRLAGVGR
jgi:5-methylthioadenosine/S-adenosylhomocysteine deaminase